MRRARPAAVRQAASVPATCNPQPGGSHICIPREDRKTWRKCLFLGAKLAPCPAPVVGRRGSSSQCFTWQVLPKATGPPASPSTTSATAGTPRGQEAAVAVQQARQKDLPVGTHALSKSRTGITGRVWPLPEDTELQQRQRQELQ